MKLVIDVIVSSSGQKGADLLPILTIHFVFRTYQFVFVTRKNLFGFGLVLISRVEPSTIKHNTITELSFEPNSRKINLFRISW